MRPIWAVGTAAAVMALLACSGSDEGPAMGPGQGGASAGDAGGAGAAAGASAGGAGGQGMGGDGSGGQSPSCYLPPACDAPAPDPGATESWLDPLTPVLVTIQGSARHRIFFMFDDPHGGRRIDDYGELLGEFGALPSLCP